MHTTDRRPAGDDEHEAAFETYNGTDWMLISPFEEAYTHSVNAGELNRSSEYQLTDPYAGCQQYAVDKSSAN